jgi:hypothetical protein
MPRVGLVLTKNAALALSGGRFPPAKTRMLSHDRADKGQLAFYPSKVTVAAEIAA